MVERITSKTAKMLNQIHSVNRWCITGTPAEKSIEAYYGFPFCPLFPYCSMPTDFFGLFAFLKFPPFSIQLYWRTLLYQPFLAAVSSLTNQESSKQKQLFNDHKDCNLQNELSSNSTKRLDNELILFGDFIKPTGSENSVLRQGVPKNDNHSGDEINSIDEDEDNSSPSLGQPIDSSQEDRKLTRRIGRTALARVLRELLWRNTKQLVGDQLALPSLTERVHWSAIL
ncbi:unnamed protein product [Protopolystoma xenopodis]|uniref:SNF2 N-terminal domain-containing protein n=1 Tax=Protopolystoma xenopodis TaxID=117903 RepID=A0A3S5CFW9_9PLAT|nr:unnamed protein product [Protopolystoma xenopodis]